MRPNPVLILISYRPLNYACLKVLVISFIEPVKEALIDARANYEPLYAWVDVAALQSSLAALNPV